LLLNEAAKNYFRYAGLFALAGAFLRGGPSYKLSINWRRRTVWEKLSHRNDFDLTLQIRQNHRTSRKIPNELAARSARRGQCIRFRHHSDGIEAAFTFADALTMATRLRRSSAHR